MQRGILALIAAAALSGFLAFGTLAHAFAREALALFIVFASASLIACAANAFISAGHAPNHGERNLLLSGRAVGTVAIASAALALASLWRDFDPDGKMLAAAMRALSAT